MKRFLLFCAIMAPCVMSAGCGSETHLGLIQKTVVLIDSAAEKIRVIKDEVANATKTAKEDGNKIDLKKAMDATKLLKEDGLKAQNLKREIGEERLKLSEQEQESNAEDQKKAISAAMERLLQRSVELE